MNAVEPLRADILEADELQQVWLEVEKECVQFWNETLMGFIEYGFMVFEIARPGQMLDTFIQWTYPEDRPLVLMPDYLELRQAGAVSDLRANVEWQALMQPQPDPATGQPVPPQQPSDYRPFMWAIAMLMPPLFEWLQKRFIALTNTALKKQ